MHVQHSQVCSFVIDLHRGVELQLKVMQYAHRRHWAIPDNKDTPRSRNDNYVSGLNDVLGGGGYFGRFNDVQAHFNDVLGVTAS